MSFPEIASWAVSPKEFGLSKRFQVLPLDSEPDPESESELVSPIENSPWQPPPQEERFSAEIF